MTPTPRTDAAETMWNDIGMMVVLATFARHLERELADWQVLQASTQARLEQAERDLADAVSVRDSLSKAADKLEKDKEYNARLCASLSAELSAERALADRLAAPLFFNEHEALSGENLEWTPAHVAAVAAYKESRRDT